MNSVANVRELAVVIPCEGEALVGIVHLPAAVAAAVTTGVVVIVGGPQYRAGSHRQFVHLARALAAAGHAVLRFDIRGMGDSTGELHNFEQITPDVDAAIGALLEHATQVRHVVLWGLCDGASAALLYQHERRDPRVRGLCLLNPWMRSEGSLARTHVKHYYLRRLLQPGFWVKALQGRVGRRALRDLAGNVRAATDKTPARQTQTFQERMAVGWKHFDGPTLLILSGRDYTAKEFVEYTSLDREWQTLLAKPDVTRHTLADADHTFSTSSQRATIEAITGTWLAQSINGTIQGSGPCTTPAGCRNHREP